MYQVIQKRLFFTKKVEIKVHFHHMHSTRLQLLERLDRLESLSVDATLPVLKSPLKDNSSKGSNGYQLQHKKSVS